MKERRYYKRYSVDVMDINGEIPFANNVKILNISLSGILLGTDKRPDLGHSYVLKLESEGVELTLQGTVVRSTLNKNELDTGENIPKYTAGLHFTHLSDEKIIALAKFIKDYIIDKP